MEYSEPKEQGGEKRDDMYDYLRVDRFMPDMLHTIALSTAFECGLVDALVRERSMPLESLSAAGSVNGRGIRLLLTILREDGVIEERDGAISLSGEFVRALEYRDLMELKSSLARLAAHDLLDHFPDFVFHPDRDRKSVV